MRPGERHPGADVQAGGEGVAVQEVPLDEMRKDAQELCDLPNKTAPWRLGSLYLANKMAGVPYFNAPWFDETTAWLESVPCVSSVFNPAQHDREQGFEPMSCPNGTPEEALAAGFVLRKALRADWEWISRNSDGLVIGPDWRTSRGTISEIACHQALGLPVWPWSPMTAFLFHGGRVDDLRNPESQLPPLGELLR